MGKIPRYYKALQAIAKILGCGRRSMQSWADFYPEGFRKVGGRYDILLVAEARYLFTQNTWD